MRQIFVQTLLFLFLFCDVFSQDSAGVKYIESRIRQIQPQMQVSHSDIPLQNVFKQFKSSYRRVVINHAGDTLVLTKNEVSRLKRALRKNMRSKYPDSLFKNSKRRSANEIVAKVEAENRFMYDSIVSNHDKDTKRPYIKLWAFSFSKPIYFRNSEWMLFHFLYYANSGGAHELSYYRKVNGRWEFWHDIYGGAW